MVTKINSLNFDEVVSKKFRKVNIRLTLKNKITDPEKKLIYGDTFEYTLDYIVDCCSKYGKDGAAEWALILHENDISTVTGEPEQAHVHIVMRYLTNSSFSFEQLKKMFPFGFIEETRSWEASVQYLLHLNDPTKTPHDVSEIKCNFEAEQLERYLRYVKIDSKKEIQQRYEQLQLEIIENEITEAEWGLRIFEEPKKWLPIQDKYGTKIKQFFAIQRQNAIELFKQSEIDVMFIEGRSGYGKTELAIALASALGKTYFCSSSENDPLDGYGGQDVLILDDARSYHFKFTNLLKLLDNYNRTSTKSRHHNKFFSGSMIIITSETPLEKWYRSDDDEERIGNVALEQLYRRITTEVVCCEKEYKVYTHNRNGRGKLLGVFVNPMGYRKQKDKEKELDTSIVEKAINVLADKHNVNLDQIEHPAPYDRSPSPYDGSSGLPF
jgi:hypothetical protein